MRRLPLPKIEQTIADINVRSHTFKVIPPDATETLKIPNSCNTGQDSAMGQRYAQDLAGVLAVAGCATIAKRNTAMFQNGPFQDRNDERIKVLFR
jgi:hypothetical protein